MLQRRPRLGLTLIELLLVIALMGILAGLAMPSSNAGTADRLKGAAYAVSADLAYARSLAVAHNSRYSVTFDVTNNRYIVEHSGSNAALDTLPDSPFRSPGDPPTQHIVDLDELPQVGGAIRLAAVTVEGNTSLRVTNVEFGPLGETTRSRATIVWLSAGAGSSRQYISVRVDPVSGLGEPGEITGSGPA